jgi:hypothetical protein
MFTNDQKADIREKSLTLIDENDETVRSLWYAHMLTEFLLIARSAAAITLLPRK